MIGEVIQVYLTSVLIPEQYVTNEVDIDLYWELSVFFGMNFVNVSLQ